MTDGPQEPAGRQQVTSDDTLRSGYRVMTQAFEQAGITSASTDARFLLLGILKLDAGALIRDGDRRVGSQHQELNDAVERRLRHEPVSRILGTREFYGRSFKVTPDVLDPRPDTECLVDLVLDILRSENRLSEPLTIADIGVGSGAIIVTLLAELDNARGIATDVSASALEVARTNAAALGVLGRLKLIETRGLDGIDDQINVIVANPPYIPAADIARLDPDVKDYDPQLALDGGTDGLQVYREISSNIMGLRGPMWIVLEVGAGQAEAVETIFTMAGAEARHRRLDLGGHVRAVALEIHR